MNTFADGIEAAAKWHDDQALSICNVPLGTQQQIDYRHHKDSAAALRALAPPAPEAVADQSEVSSSELTRHIVYGQKRCLDIARAIKKEFKGRTL